MRLSLPRTEVLIVGGGPAGAAAAILLARAGRLVTLVEREREPKHKVCGEFLSEEALTMLALLGIDPGQLGAPPIATVRLASNGSLSEAALPFRARSLTRRCLDAQLLQTAELAGVQVLRGIPVDQLAPNGAGWRAQLQGGSTVAAPAAILATGKHDLRGYPRPPGSQADLVALKMYFRLRTAQQQALTGAVELLCHRGGYTGLQLVEDGSANLCALVTRGTLAQLGGWQGLLAQLRRENAHAALRLEGAEPLLAKPLALGAIPYGLVRQQAVSAPGLYAVGDQAAVIPSFTGDGMSMALYSGFAAARSLLAAETAAQFQARLARVLGRQVSGATLLSRALVHPAAGPLLALTTRVWPGALRAVAARTRLGGGRAGLLE